MLKKQDIRAVAAVVVGVMLAGFLMFTFSDIGIVNKARNGFDA